LITTRSAADSLASAEAPAKPPVRHYHPLWKRKLASLSRWLHIYLSMASFTILLFFAATGFTLNHQDWFARQQKTVQTHGALNAQWVKSKVDELQVVEFLRKQGLHGAVDDFRIEDSQCSVSLKGPGYEADAAIDRATGSYDVTETRAGWVAIVNDLHKGRDAGAVWSKIIDISAMLMVAVSLTGLILLFYLHKRRRAGFIMLAAGAMLIYVVYAIWTP
jgi:uncharacterized protein